MTQNNEPTPAVYAEGLRKNFSGHHAVDGIDLRVCTGEIFGVLGPNGAGKTTMLRMLAAAKVRLMSVEDVCRRLGNRFALLRSGAGNVHAGRPAGRSRG